MAARGVPPSSTVYTPKLLAAAMVASISSPNADSEKWLDPCTGEGAFVRAMREQGVSKARVTAIDLRRKREPADAIARTKRGVDFVAWAATTRAQFDRVVMNPPYVTIGRLSGSAREAAMAVRTPNGRLLPLNANYWCAFVLAAIRVIRPGGCLCVVLPASWDYAAYARAVRDAVAAAFGEVVEIRSASPLFPRVLEGSVVVVARRRGDTSCVWRRAEVSDIGSAIDALQTMTSGRTPTSRTVIRPARDRTPPLVPLDELVDIRIGAVTGDVQYFLLSESQRRSKGLPRNSVRPVVTRARHLDAAEINTARWRQLVAAGERVWLFYPTASSLRNAAVIQYLAAAEDGACKMTAYKISRRKPWYMTRLPRQAHGFISGMSRNLPHIALNGKRSLTATNTLYVVTFRRAFESPRARIAVALALLTSAAGRAMSNSARRYADGLRKFEPAELRRIRVPVPRVGPKAKQVLESATKLLVAGRVAEAQAIADNWHLGAPASHRRRESVASAPAIKKARER